MQGDGVYPWSDPWGYEFSRTYEPARFKWAGQPLVIPGSGASFGVLDGIQADLEFIKKVLFLQRNLVGFLCGIYRTDFTVSAIQGDYTRKQCCFLCGALQWIYRHGDPDGLPNDPSLLYSNFGEEAAHRQTFLATL